MKLFLHDAKHDRVIAEFALDGLTASERALVDGLIAFLENHGVFDRYCMARIAEGCRWVPSRDIFDEPYHELEFY